MENTITLTYNDEEYTLGFSRRSEQQMEKAGFVLDQIATYPNTMIPMLFAGAFLMRHPKVKEEIINAIYNKVEDKEGLLQKLVEMYNEGTSSLMENPEDADPKKISWKANF